MKILAIADVAETILPSAILTTVCQAAGMSAIVCIGDVLAQGAPTSNPRPAAPFLCLLAALGLPTAVVPGPHDSPTLLRQAMAARGEGAPPVLLDETVMTWGEVAIGAISSDRAAPRPYYGDEQGAKTPGRRTDTRLLAARLSSHGGVAD